VVYGATGGGGAYGLGAVFSLTPPGTPGGAWTEAVLYSFAGNSYGDGAGPNSGVVMDGAGVLYGTTSSGGYGECRDQVTNDVVGCGTLFSVTPPASPGGAWTEAVVYSFGGAERTNPNGDLVLGSGGVLYGTTTFGGAGSCLAGSGFFPITGCGTIFSMPTAPGGAGAAPLLYSFTPSAGGDGNHTGVAVGAGPSGAPIVYAATFTSGSQATGQIFSLSPPEAPGGPWIATALYELAGRLGVQPNSLAVGGGVLYGTTSGGTWDTAAPTVGEVFSLTPPGPPAGGWTETTLYTFTEAATGIPNSVTGGGGGVLYGTTSLYPCSSTGSSNCGGAVFSLTPPSAPVGQWTESTLCNFPGGSDGGNPNPGLAVGSDGLLYGTTQSFGNAAAGTVFALKVAIPQPSINPGGLVSSASYAAPVAPGSIASVFGGFFVPALSAAQSPLPDGLGGLSLQFGSTTAAPLFFVSGGQVNLQVPWELAGQTQTALAGTLNGQTGAAQTVNLAPFAPAIFSTNAQGSGQGAILDQSNHLVDASKPATPGSTVLQIFCTGLGLVSNQPLTGSPASLAQLSYTSVTPTVTVGNVAADVSFSGLAPGYVGLYQVNALVPAGLAANNATPVVISMQGTASNMVTIAVE